MAQSAITNYFANRKRPAVDDLKGKSKVRVISADVGGNTGYSALNSSENASVSVVARVKVEKTVVFGSDPSNDAPKPKPQGLNVAKPKASPRARKPSKPKDAKQPGMTRFLTCKSETKSSSEENSSVLSQLPRAQVSESNNIKEEQVTGNEETHVKEETEVPNEVAEPVSISIRNTDTSESVLVSEVTPVKIEISGKATQSIVTEKVEDAKAEAFSICSNVSKNVVQAEKKESAVEKARRVSIILIKL